MSKWIKIIENDSFIVEFNKATNTYRVSYFEDCHFKDEICFKGHKELEQKEETPEKTWATEDLHKELEDLLKTPHILASEHDAFLSDACKTCPNHPSNGGFGHCNCTLGLTPVTYATNTSIRNGGI